MKTIERMLDDLFGFMSEDFIPNGSIAGKISNARPVPEGCFGRCCRQVGDDIQSGPLYCGDRAVVMADAGEGKIVYACKQHEARFREDCK